MPDKKILINYANRDFTSIKRDLEEHARRYYPDTYKDFSENSFGSYILDTVSHVGDMLSFYLDYQVNESFLETAIEYENVRRLAKNVGYKFTGRPAAFGVATFYVIIPANTSGLGPDLALIPIVQTGTELRATSGTTFVLTEDVDFANAKNEVIAARFSDTTGKPTYYAIRAHGQVKSTVLYRTTVKIGSFTRFQRVKVGGASIAEIRSVVDSEGHDYYQVDHLSQDVIYINTTNPNAASDGVPQIMKPKIVPRRYVLEQDNTGTYLQFGYGTDEELTTSDIADPSQITLKMSGKTFTTDSAFDPTKLLDSNTLGVAPSDTTLTISFYQNDSDSVNVAQGNLNTISVSSMTFPGADGVRDALQPDVRTSLEVSNDVAIVGNTSAPTSEEIRYRSYAAKAAQQRSVTRTDYEAYVYMMPPSFGSIKRTAVVNDPSSSNRRLSVYVTSEDENGYLIESNSTIKQNVKSWLNKNKMLNDNIDIYDARIVNIGFDYEIIVHPTKDKIEVLTLVNQKLKSELSNKMYIGEPFYLTSIYSIINKVPGVIDTTKVTPILKTGANYNSAPVTIEEMKSMDGTYLRAPRNVIFEIKLFNSDIRGAAV
jgi:hypothetical protein